MLPTGAMVGGVRAAGGVPPGQIGDSPYGPLRTEPDENGLLLPEGFTSRIIAIAGEKVGDTDYEWHLYPDGAATFDDGEGGWYYTVNSEVFDFMKPDSGGVSTIHFDADGNITEAYRILSGSNSNCAGGPTPWGTWLSGEENFSEIGRVWECDPTGKKEPVAHEAMGLFAHEAAAVDPDDERVYLTQDDAEGLFYRYTPDNYPDLSSGTLEACIVAADGSVTWGAVADPSGKTAPTKTQVAGATVFPGNEGCWYHDGWVYFTSKYDHSVHGIDLREQTYRLIWKGDPDGLGVEGAVLSGVDNITVDAGSGDLVVAEDGANMELVLITAEGVVAPLVRIAEPGHEESEVTGPVFNPRRDRLYFSSQRGPTPRAAEQIVEGLVPVLGGGGGITYEITGPFRGIAEVAAPTTEPPSTDAPSTEPPATQAPTTIPSPVTTLANAAGATTAPSSEDSDDGGGNVVGPVVIGAAVVAAAVGGLVAFRQRRSGGSTDSGEGTDDTPA